MPKMLDAALEYVKLGFRVFPVKLDKTPFTEHGLKDATETIQGVREFWTKFPNANIGTPTDELVVIDFDLEHGGIESKAILESTFGALPPTRTHITGGGGFHFLYRNPNGRDIRNTTKLAGYDGVDIRANGGYIVMPPSLHKSGNRYQVSDNSPIADCPEWLLELTDVKMPVYDGDTGEKIPQGQNDNWLYNRACAYRGKGDSEDIIFEKLRIDAKRLDQDPTHPYTDKDFRRIAKSSSKHTPNEDTFQKLTKLTSQEKTDTIDNNPQKLDNTDPIDIIDATDKLFSPKRGRIVWRLVDLWLLEHQGERFDLDTICRHLDLRILEDRHHVVKKLAYEVAQKKLEKSEEVRPSIYRYINNTYKLIDWVNAPSTPPLTIKFPYGIDDKTRFGFDGHVIISPSDIIVVAGVSNMGKTTWCLNFLWLNMDSYPCTLMGNEYEASKFKRRTSRMTWANPLTTDGKSKFELIERYDNWKDIIRPNNINIIDWINLSDNFYQMGAIIEGIKSRLNNGIAVISLQKTENKQLGLGGGFSEHLASLYLSIDFERLTVRKVKEWYEKNTNGKVYGFKIIDGGVKFANIREVKKCFRCGGTGNTKMGECQSCLGRGYIDL